MQIELMWMYLTDVNAFDDNDDDDDDDDGYGDDYDFIDLTLCYM